MIVVGAGPAGVTASIRMAREGLKVLLIERAEVPGQKNMFGGMMPYCPALEQVVPNFYEVAPIERYVTRRGLHVLSEGDLTAIWFESKSFEGPPHNGYTLFRPLFDKWYAKQAERVGARLVTSLTVREPLMQGRSVRGVRVEGGGEIFAPCVLACDGILSLLSKSAGLYRKKILPEDMALGVKVLLYLGEKHIDERFNLLGGRGCTMEFVGCTEGVRGGGFIYTQQETLSVGLVLHLDSLKRSGRTPYGLLESFLSNEYVRRFVRGGRIIEYSAHLLSEGGIRMVPKLFTDGMLVAGDAASLCYTNGLTQEGMNLAVTSGLLAAETVIEAHSRGDFSSRSLRAYEHRLRESFVLKDMETFKGLSRLMHNDRLFTVYPKIVSSVMREMFRSDGKQKMKPVRVVMRSLLKDLSIKEGISDIVQIGRSIL